MRKTLAPLVAFAVILILICGGLVALRPAAERALSDSVVLVIAESKVATGVGTGFVVQSEYGPRVYTCAHVVDGAKAIYVQLRDGRYQWAKLLRRNDFDDLAELAIGDYPPALRLRSFPPREFEPVSEIGNPIGFRFITTSGHFVQLYKGQNQFLIDTFLGNSGSPIIDANGFVIGMTHSLILGTRYTGGGTLEELRDFIFPAAPR